MTGSPSTKTDKITFDDFMKYTFEARDGKAYLQGKQLKTRQRGNKAWRR